MASMIPIQRSPLQQLVQEWIIQTRVREIPDISRRAGRSQRPVPGWRALYCNIPCQQAGKIYSESYLWTAEIRRLQLEGYRYTVRKYGYFYGITGSSSYCDSESGSDTDKSEICSADGRQYTDHDICDHFDRGCGMYWRNPCISQKEKIRTECRRQFYSTLRTKNVRRDFCTQRSVLHAVTSTL